MKPGVLDPVVLGHNSFFGVDHLSRQRGEARAALFERTEAILDMVRFCRDRGVSAMMMSTHPRAALVAGAVRRAPDLRDEVTFYPLVPYIAKYVREANEKGLVNVVLDQLRGSGLAQKLQIMGTAGLAMLRRDPFGALRSLLKLEMAPFKGLKLRAVFLHDALTDLGLAIGLRSAFELFADEVQNRFEAQPAFATKNLPLLLRRFGEWGFHRPLVLSHFNKAGFNMNPTRAACESALRAHDVQVMAMGTLASGYLRPDEAYSYLFSLPRIDSVVVGVSSPAHAEETFAAIRRHRPQPEDSPRRAPAQPPAATKL